MALAYCSRPDFSVALVKKLLPGFGKLRALQTTKVYTRLGNVPPMRTGTFERISKVPEEQP